MRLGILGGTFDPVHIGHLITAECVLEELSLDGVLFIPANIPPHKTERKIISSYHRLRMVCFATANNPRFKVSDIELNRDGIVLIVAGGNAYRDIFRSHIRGGRTFEKLSFCGGDKSGGKTSKRRFNRAFWRTCENEHTRSRHETD